MNENERTITVTGQGGIHVVPDVTRLDIFLISIHDSYEEAYVQASMNTETMNRIMTEAELDTKLPKTKSLDIEKETQNEYDKHHNYIGEKFIGFKLSHIIKIDLGMDNAIISKVVKLIGQKLKQAEINIGYTVRDPRPCQLRMLERAVKDAKEKAEIMVKACGSELGTLRNIDYSFHEFHIYSQARNIHDSMDAMCCNEESLDINPDDLAVSDSVRVTWDIK